MAAPERVTDLDDPRLLPFRNQKDQWLRARHRGAGAAEAGSGVSGTGLAPALPGDLFIAEGLTLLERLVASPHRTLSVLVSEHRLAAARPVLEGVPAEAEVFVASREVVAEIVGFDLHRGVLACGRRVETHSADALIDHAGTVVVLEGLSNHDNVGSIFRSVAALAPDWPGPGPRAGVLLAAGCCDPLYRKALRVSMGASLAVPFAEIGSWPSGLDALASSGCRVIALTPGPGSVELTAMDPPKAGERVALVMGTEGRGLAEATLEACERAGGVRGRIAIDPAVDSLNVGVAAAIALHFVRISIGDRSCSFSHRHAPS